MVLPDDTSFSRRGYVVNSAFHSLRQPGTAVSSPDCSLLCSVQHTWVQFLFLVFFFFFSVQTHFPFIKVQVIDTLHGLVLKKENLFR